MTVYEASLCPCGCGYPRKKAWDSEADGWFEGRAQVCYARAAIERWREENGKEAEPGTLLYVIDSREESAADGPLDRADGDEPEAGEQQ